MKVVHPSYLSYNLIFFSRKEIQGGILYELNGGFTKEALEKLIDYAYTARYVAFYEFFIESLEKNENLAPSAATLVRSEQNSNDKLKLVLIM